MIMNSVLKSVAPRTIFDGFRWWSGEWWKAKAYNYNKLHSVPTYIWMGFVGIREKKFNSIQLSDECHNLFICVLLTMVIAFWRYIILTINYCDVYYREPYNDLFDEIGTGSQRESFIFNLLLSLLSGWNRFSPTTVGRRDGRRDNYTRRELGRVHIAAPHRRTAV